MRFYGEKLYKNRNIIHIISFLDIRKIKVTNNIHSDFALDIRTCLSHYSKRGVIFYDYLLLSRYLDPTIYKRFTRK